MGKVTGQTSSDFCDWRNMTEWLQASLSEPDRLESSVAVGTLNISPNFISSSLKWGLQNYLLGPLWGLDWAIPILGSASPLYSGNVWCSLFQRIKTIVHTFTAPPGCWALLCFVHVTLYSHQVILWVGIISSIPRLPRGKSRYRGFGECIEVIQPTRGWVQTRTLHSTSVLWGLDHVRQLGKVVPRARSLGGPVSHRISNSSAISVVAQACSPHLAPIQTNLGLPPSR